MRALDRFEYSIVNRRLQLGDPYSVSGVSGTGASAQITKYTLQAPGQQVDGIESWLYPLQPARFYTNG